jgi:hypothetical protein
MPKLFLLGCLVPLLDVTILTAAEPASTIEFNRDIRPILSDSCYLCHGPAKATRKAGLRFDTQEGAFADLGGYHAIVPGKLEDSRLWQRITAADPAKKMPPHKSGRKLTERQVELLRRWIEQGAKWENHWSFIAPRQAPLPTIHARHWPRNAIDHFVLARLEQNRLQPSPEAERATLLRRVTFDLTGLPPTLVEVDAFLADQASDAYGKVVDRLPTGPLTRSTRTCRSTSSPSSRLPATCCRVRASLRKSLRASTATICSTAKGAASSRNRASIMSSIAWIPRSLSGSA